MTTPSIYKDCRVNVNICTTNVKNGQLSQSGFWIVFKSYLNMQINLTQCQDRLKMASMLLSGISAVFIYTFRDILYLQCSFYCTYLFQTCIFCNCVCHIICYRPTTSGRSAEYALACCDKFLCMFSWLLIR